MNNVVGLPAQAVMDMLTVILAEDHDDIPNLHCKDSVAYVINTFTKDDAWETSPCKPLNSALYPDWECLDPDSRVTTHHKCVQKNTNKECYYCTCPQQIAAVTNDKGDRVLTYSYFFKHEFRGTVCQGCLNDHSKPTPCPMCGEVHP